MLQKLRSKKGQGMSEYLIILALVAIATIGAVIFFADNVRQQIGNIAEELVGNDQTVDNAQSAFTDERTASYEMDTFTDSND